MCTTPHPLQAAPHVPPPPLVVGGFAYTPTRCKYLVLAIAPPAAVAHIKVKRPSYLPCGVGLTLQYLGKVQRNGTLVPPKQPRVRKVWGVVHPTGVYSVWVGAAGPHTAIAWLRGV